MCSFDSRICSILYLILQGSNCFFHIYRCLQMGNFQLWIIAWHRSSNPLSGLQLWLKKLEPSRWVILLWHLKSLCISFLKMIAQFPFNVKMNFPSELNLCQSIINFNCISKFESVFKEVAQGWNFIWWVSLCLLKSFIEDKISLEFIKETNKTKNMIWTL